MQGKMINIISLSIENKTRGREKRDMTREY